MYQNYKVVVNTAAGRRRYMQYLIPYVLSSEIVDRYDLWINTMNCQDIAFFKEISKKYPKLNLIWQPDGEVNGNKSINAFYKKCIDEDTIYFKLDDDIIWMENGLIEKMIKFRLDNPQYFLVTPLVINNSLTTYLFQVNNKIQLQTYYKSSASHEILWKSGKFALDLHNWFLNNYLLQNKIDCLHLGGAKPMGMTRFSINAILWFGKEMKKFNGIVPGDDEEFLSCIYPTKQGLANCWNGDAIVSHFAFFTQREFLDKEHILERYGDYLQKYWENDKIANKVFSDINIIMEQIDTNKIELPPAPYKQIVHDEPYMSVAKMKQKMIQLIPHSIFCKLKDKKVNSKKYI